MNPSQLELKKFIAQQAQYIYDIPKWAYEILKFDCDQWQRDAYRDLVEKKFCAWSTGTGVGKTAALAIAILHFASTRPFPKIPCTAPSQHQLYDVLWAEIAKWLRRSEMLSKLFKWTQTKVSLRGHEEEWYAVARTSRPKPGEMHAEGLQGFHAEHLLFVVDEASAIDKPIFSAMDGAFTTPGVSGIIASNPTRRSGYFFEQITDPDTTYAVRFVDANDCKMVTPESIARIVKKYGIESDYYRTKVLGLPPLIDSAALITKEQVDAAHQRELAPVIKLVGGSEEPERVVLSCDPARFGDDNSVFFARRERRVFERLHIHGMNTQELAKVGLGLIKTHNARMILVDVIGIGAGVVDRLEELIREQKLDCVVVAVNVAEKAVDEAQFSNKRAEMCWHLRDVIENCSLELDTPLLDEELIALRYTAEKKIQMVPKEEVKRLIGRSPNDADSLGLLFYDEILNPVLRVSSTYGQIGISDSARSAVSAPQNIIDLEQFQQSRVVGARRYSQFRTSFERSTRIFPGF